MSALSQQHEKLPEMRKNAPLTVSKRLESGPCGRPPDAGIAERDSHLSKATHRYGERQFARADKRTSRGVGHSNERPAAAEAVFDHDVRHHRTAAGAETADNRISIVVVKESPRAQPGQSISPGKEEYAVNAVQSVELVYPARLR